MKKYSTENRNKRTYNIDKCDSLGIVKLINREDKRVAKAVKKALPQIAEAIDICVERLNRGGRMLYVGCGTSGRMGVLDASECPPTYGVDPGLVVGIIAGGEFALRNAVEGAEDDGNAGAEAMETNSVTEKDVVIGLSASGQAEYVFGALAEAKKRGAATVMVCNAWVERYMQMCDVYVAAIVGPEAITGSSRMKAGTSEKMILNMLSTGTMVRLGKTYGNLMIDMIPSNKKLERRSVTIVSEIVGVDRDQAAALLEKAGGKAKTAIVMALGDCDKAAAETALKENGGIARRAIDALKQGRV